MIVDSQRTSILLLALFLSIAFSAYILSKHKSSALRAQANKKKSSEFFLIIGLLISSVFDPASKARVEAIDSERNRKFEPGKENE